MKIGTSNCGIEALVLQLTDIDRSNLNKLKAVIPGLAVDSSMGSVIVETGSLGKWIPNGSYGPVDRIVLAYLGGNNSNHCVFTSQVEGTISLYFPTGWYRIHS